METVFAEIAALLAIATVVGLLGLALRQPLIVSFIAVGLLVGPNVLGLVTARAHVELLAEIGVALLLFLVGLKLDLKLVRTLGPVAVATGLGQVAFTSLFGFLIALGLGLEAVPAAYVAVALTFSSTIIIVKLLSDKREIDSLHGRIALGFLIVQDLAVVAAMVVLSTTGMGGGPDIARVLVGGVVLAVGLAVFIRYLAEPLLRRVAHSPELLVTAAVGWAVLLAAVAEWIGFGKELGGLLAGVTLASTSFRESISSRLASVRDFLLLFFFIGLGSHLDLGLLGHQVWPAIVLSLFVLIGNPLIVVAIMGYMGYRKRTGFMAGLTVAQISEFSLIFMAMGLALGQVDEAAVGLVTLVGLVTITLSTYMILYSQYLYRWLEPLLGPFERRVPQRELDDEARIPEGTRADAILIGLGRYGCAIGEALESQGWRLLGVDFDPEAVRHWKGTGREGLYGDAADPEFLAELPLTDVRWVILATPPMSPSLAHADPRLALLAGLRQAGFAGRVAVTSHRPSEAEDLRQAGADCVFHPFADAATRAAERLTGALAAET